MSFLNTNRSVVLLRSGSYDASVLDETHAFKCTEPVVVNPETEGGESKDTYAGVNSKEYWKDWCNTTVNFSISHHLTESNGAADALNTPPFFGELLKMGGFIETVNTDTPGEESVTYYNAQTPLGGTVVIYSDDFKYTGVAGSAIANIDFDFTAGQPAILNAKIETFLTDAKPTSEANPVVTQAKEKKLIVGCLNILKLDGTIIPFDKLKISFNADTNKYYSTGGATNAIRKFDIKDYDLTAEISWLPEKGADTFDIIDDLKSETAMLIELKLNPDASGNLQSGKSLFIKATKAVPKDIDHSDSNEKLNRTLTLKLQNDSTQTNNEALSISAGYFA